jgi:uncharacterized protein YdeI (YjbR/CyaY-like superfamily)
MVSKAHADAERFEPSSLAEWSEWLEANHARPSGVWLVTWKRATGRQFATYEETVTEALRVGWVDSVTQGLDEQRSMLWFAPRKAASGWSKPNKDRIARLESTGRMLPAGAAVVARAQADGSWSKLDAVEALEVPDDLAAAFAALPGSADHWEAFPRSAKRGILEWIVQAKRPETRAKRIAETAEKAQRGERANQWSPKR